MAIDRAELIEKALRETESPPPRQVGIRPLGEAPGLWGRILAGVVGCLLISNLIIYGSVIPIIACHYGTPAQANIVNLWITHGKSTSYNVRVEYADGNENATGTAVISPGVYNGLHVGQIVGVHFFHSFHGVPSMDFSPPNPMGGLPLLIFIVIFLVVIAKPMSQRRLLIIGKAAKGRVASQNLKNMSISFSYEGNEYSLTALNNLYSRNNKTGDEVVVLFDPDNPQKNMVYDPSNCLWIPTGDYGSI